MPFRRSELPTERCLERVKEHHMVVLYCPFSEQHTFYLPNCWCHLLHLHKLKPCSSSVSCHLSQHGPLCTGELGLKSAYFFFLPYMLPFADLIQSQCIIINVQITSNTQMVFPDLFSISIQLLYISNGLPAPQTQPQAKHLFVTSHMFCFTKFSSVSNPSQLSPTTVKIHHLPPSLLFVGSSNDS